MHFTTEAFSKTGFGKLMMLAYFETNWQEMV